MKFSNYYNPADKETVINDYLDYMFAKLASMFKYEGLPKTINPKVLEYQLMRYGVIGFFAYNGELYESFGGYGGELDYNYLPTKFIVANPYLKYDKALKVDNECIVMWNDSSRKGLYPLCLKYATMLCENELSLYMATINSRMQQLITCPDDSTRAAAQVYLDNLIKGKLTVLADNSFLGGIQMHSIGQGYDALRELTERQTYIEGKFWNEIGVNANFEGKRESLASEEIQVNSEALLPRLTDMLYQRKQAVEKINDMFGTSITVEFASSWEDNEEELELEHMKEEAEVEQIVAQASDEEELIKEEPEKEGEEDAKTE